MSEGETFYTKNEKRTVEKLKKEFPKLHLTTLPQLQEELTRRLDSNYHSKDANQLFKIS